MTNLHIICHGSVLSVASVCNPLYTVGHKHTYAPWCTATTYMCCVSQIQTHEEIGTYVLQPRGENTRRFPSKNIMKYRLADVGLGNMVCLSGERCPLCKTDPNTEAHLVFQWTAMFTTKEIIKVIVDTVGLLRIFL